MIDLPEIVIVIAFGLGLYLIDGRFGGAVEDLCVVLEVFELCGLGFELGLFLGVGLFV